MSRLYRGSGSYGDSSTRTDCGYGTPNLSSNRGALSWNVIIWRTHFLPSVALNGFMQKSLPYRWIVVATQRKFGSCDSLYGILVAVATHAIYRFDPYLPHQTKRVRFDFVRWRLSYIATPLHLEPLSRFEESGWAQQ